MTDSAERRGQDGNQIYRHEIAETIPRNEVDSLMEKVIRADFQSLKDYAGMRAKDLFREWLSASADNFQRFFICQAINAKTDFVNQLNEKERRKFLLKKSKERRKFKLAEDETLIYSNADMIHHPGLRVIFISGLILPFIVMIWLCYFFGNFWVFLAAFGWAIFYSLAALSKIFKTKLFLTNYRLGFCVTIFWKINLFFSSFAIKDAILWADIFIPGNQVDMGVRVSIRQVNDDVHRRYCLPVDVTFIFLECLTAIVRETGGNIYIPEFTATGRGRKRREVVFVHQFTGCSLADLKNWFFDVMGLMKKEAGLASSNKQQLRAVAAFFSDDRDNGRIVADTAIKKNTDKAEAIIARLPGYNWNPFSKSCDVLLTDKEFVVTEAGANQINARYPYGSVNIERHNERIKIYFKGKFLFSLYIFFGTTGNPREMSFPLVGVLRLLGCPAPVSYQHLGGGVFYDIYVSIDNVKRS